MAGSNWKRSLVATGFGRAMLRGREMWKLWRTIRKMPERGGTACQDACARLLLPRLALPGSVFLDVGAHIGSVIAAVRGCHPRMSVIAVEAVAEKAEHIRRKFRDVVVHDCAVGATEGEVVFYMDADRSGCCSLDASNLAGSKVIEVRIPMRRLDDLIPEAAKVDVFKIDVEGAELGALRGAEKVVARCRPTIFFESGPRDEAELRALFDWFAGQNYEVLLPNRVPHFGTPLTADGFVESHCYPFRSQNYFAVAAERRDEVRDRARVVLGTTLASPTGSAVRP